MSSSNGIKGTFREETSKKKKSRKGSHGRIRPNESLCLSIMWHTYHYATDHALVPAHEHHQHACEKTPGSYLHSGFEIGETNCTGQHTFCYKSRCHLVSFHSSRNNQEDLIRPDGKKRKPPITARYVVVTVLQEPSPRVGSQCREGEQLLNSPN